ncbi:MAG: hypothetical protein GF388_05090 [Candidatus Aegiribacteria sp.]|nr:hypothetical protein [Candidatus Aegiribacteria sp.]
MNSNCPASANVDAETDDRDEDETSGQDDDQSEDDEEESDDENDRSDSFLDPYYESDEDSGCTLKGCDGFWDIFRVIASIDVSYSSRPSGTSSRVMLGDRGNAVAMDMSTAYCLFDEGGGYETAVDLRTPSPIVVDFMFQRVLMDDQADFSILYAGVLSQLVYASPMEAMLGTHGVFPSEDGRETLGGIGFTMKLRYTFSKSFASFFDYRLSWVHNLPLQKGFLGISWQNAPMEIFAGYSALRNSRGEYVYGPGAGAGLFF